MDIKPTFNECTGTVHDEAVEVVRRVMPPDEDFSDLADLYKMFSDSTRVRIMWALHIRELCVCDISALLGMTMSAVSHQLRQLRQTNLVKSRRQGKTVFYSLADEHVEVIFENGFKHIKE